MTKFVSLILAVLMMCSFSSVALAAEGGGALPKPQFSVLANKAYSKAVPYQSTDRVRAESTQRDEIKTLLASFRADSLTKVLVSEVQAASPFFFIQQFHSAFCFRKWYYSGLLPAGLFFGACGLALGKRKKQCRLLAQG